jgi:hypothetical protein
LTSVIIVKGLNEAIRCNLTRQMNNFREAASENTG